MQQTPNIDLEQGKNLPEYLKSDVDDDVKCKPLKDIDTFYEEKEVTVFEYLLKKIKWHCVVFRLLRYKFEFKVYLL